MRRRVNPRGFALAALFALGASGCQGAPAGPAPSSAPAPDRQPPVSAPAGAQATDHVPTVDAGYDVTTASSVTVVVTKRRPLEPLDYVPETLVSLAGVPGGDGLYLRSDAADALVRMAADASAAGAGFRVSSGYRSYADQRAQYGQYVAQYGRAYADTISARPGYSEHQTGLTVDLHVTEEDRGSAVFASTAAGVWVAEHADEYGFVESYPQGGQAVTGYRWEPWHLRYVGADVASAMRASGHATLQEFMGVEDSPDYG